MSLEELKTNIVEEVGDAVKYMEKAVEHKGTEWGTWFCQMSKNELEHANILLRMFNKTEKPNTVTDAEHAKMYKEIMQTYTDSMTKVEAMKKIYWSE